MAFDEKEWMTKMDRAQMAEEIRAVVTELPDRGPPMTYDDPDYFFMEPVMTSEPSISTTKITKT